MRKTLLPAIAVILFIGTTAAAQSTFHIFPQFVDGKFADGSYYKSTVLIVSETEDDAPQCSMTLNGMSAIMDLTGSRGVFSFMLPKGGSLVSVSTGTQAFQSGYATLTCDLSVHATVLMTSYTPDAKKLGEAAIFSATPRVISSLAFDNRENSRLGVALANDTDVTVAVRLLVSGDFGARITVLSIPPRRNISRFLDELLPIPANAVGNLRVVSLDSGSVAAVGFRFSGSLFATLPAN